MQNEYHFVSTTHILNTSASNKATTTAPTVGVAIPISTAVTGSTNINTINQYGPPLTTSSTIGVL